MAKVILIYGTASSRRVGSTNRPSPHLCIKE